MDWRIFHKEETDSTNNDAKAGVHGDVFTASFQTAGRGRLDHKWLSRRGDNLMMSAVLDVGGLDVAHAATLPLAVGLAVVNAVSRLLGPSADVKLKWTNDVYVSGRKISGILCERCGDNVIVGIGVNVRQKVFAEEISARAVSLALLGVDAAVDDVRDRVLGELARVYATWREGGFEAVYDAIAAVDWLKGREVRVVQTDSDRAGISGICAGIARNGAVIVGDEEIWAGEARVIAR